MTQNAFKYGSYFGITAIHLMFMDVTEVDDLFKMTNIKRSTLFLIRNLYKEVTALKKIFADEELEGMPHVYSKVDDSSERAKNLVSGFNYYIQLKNGMTGTDSPKESALEDSMKDLLSMPDIFENIEQAEDVSSSSGEDETSFFGESTDAEDNTDLNSFMELSVSDDFDSLFDGISSEEVAEPDISISPDNESDYFGSFFGGLSESYGEDIITTVDNDTDMSYIIEHLEEVGSRHVINDGEISIAGRIKPYLLRHRSDFSDEERSSIIKQLNALPKSPIKVALPHNMPNQRQTLSAVTKQLLSRLYENMTKPAPGDTIFIDYVLAKLSFVLSSPDCISGKLFFVNRESISDDNRAIYLWNYTLAELTKSFLSQDNPSVLKSNIVSLLKDCDEVLQPNNRERSISYTSEDIKGKLSELVDMRYSGCINDVVDFLSSIGLLGAVAVNMDNLVLITTIYASLLKVTNELRNIITEIANSDDIPQQCILFTQETGICGLYCDFKPALACILQQHQAPLAKKTRTAYSKNSNGWLMATRLKKHLLSMKLRLFGGIAV